MTCLATTSTHIISGSEDSNIHIWSLPTLLSLSTIGAQEPVRSLSNHRAAITHLVTGHSAGSGDILVSASKDNTCIVWDYHTGTLLRTYLLPATPLCLALDPCDRAAYAGFEDGSVRLIDFFAQSSTVNPLYDSKLQTTPVQVAPDAWVAPFEAGATNCIAVTYDGTSLLTGHAAGKVVQWDVGRRGFSADLVDLNAPVTNLLVMSPFADKHATRAVNVVKPRLGEVSYTYTAQLTGDLMVSPFQQALNCPGFSADVLDDAIMGFGSPGLVSTSAVPVEKPGSAGEEQLQAENEGLKASLVEAKALQKKTWEKYCMAKFGSLEAQPKSRVSS